VKRRVPLRRKTGLRRVSKRRLQSGYFDLRWEFLLQHPLCEVCGHRRSRDVHHRLGRGECLLEIDTFLAVCRSCHIRIHDNPQWAREHGYLGARL
jgi:hypothetical protein